MREQQNRLTRACATITDYEVAFAWIGAEDLDVFSRKARRLQPRRHRFGSFGAIADGIGGVDFDELFEDVVGELTRGRKLLGLRGCCNTKCEQ